MSGTILQEVQTSDGTGTALASISITLTSNATSGSVFHVFACGDASTWTSGNGTFSDGTNTYVPIGSVHDSAGGQRLTHAYVATNSTTGKTTIKFTPPSNTAFLGIWVREIGGVKNQAPDGTATTFVTPSTTTPSTTLSNTNQPAFMSAMCSDQNVTQQPNVSGSLSLGARGWQFGGANNSTTTAQESLTTTGSQTAAFSLPSADQVTIMAAMWDVATPVGAAFISNSTAKNVGKSGLTTSITPASSSKNVSTGKASATTSIRAVAGGRAKSTAGGVPTTVIAAVAHALGRSTGGSSPTTAIRLVSAASSKSTGTANISIVVVGPTAGGAAKSSATASATTAIRAAAGGSAKSTATSVPTTAIKPASVSRSASRAQSSLTTSSPLISQATARSSGHASATTHIPLVAAAHEVSSANVAFADNAVGGAKSTNVSSAKGQPTAWAFVTLTSPLYTGEGSVVGSHARWSNGAPGVGSVVYYDPTYITVLPDGTVSSTTNNNVKAEVQWLPAPGTASFLPLLVTSGFASWSQNDSSGAGQPLTAIALASSAHEVNSARSALTTRSSVLAHATAKNTAIASGFITGIALRSNSGARSSASGTPATAIRLSAAGASVASLGGTFGLGANLSSTSRARCSGRAALSSHVAFVSFPRSVSTAFGAPAFGAQLVSAATSASRAAASLATAIDLAAVSYSVSTASARGNTELVSRAGSRSSGSLSGLTPSRFGWAEVIALSQDGFQSVESAYAENSAVYVQATYFDSTDAPFVPNAVTYRVDDVSSGINIVPTTSIEPEETNIVNIPASENYMVNATRDSEQHQAVFEIIDGFGNVAIAQTVFDVIRVTGT